MKERPILFSAPMVRALLAGTKTQTRRVMRHQPAPDGTLNYTPTARIAVLAYKRGEIPASMCPYGQPGDRLWVRENGWERPERSPRDLREGADTWPPYEYDAEPVSTLSAEDMKAWKWKRRPSIHMSRWASRITLEVVAVRVERLQDISEADAMAEGAPPSHPSIDKISREFGYEDFPRSWYAQLWEQINGAGSWTANPWVWVVEFKRVPA